MNGIRAKANGEKVVFGDVVGLCRTRSRNPQDDGFERYIGLEHLDPGELKVRRWASVADGTTFTNVFRPGQVLFGKRRAYQRKIAVADFSGVCSSDIYVFEPRDGRLLPELLPFLCQTNEFFDFAIGTSAGSLSPRTSWDSLANYEFTLPPLGEQLHIVEALRAAEEHGQALRQLSTSTAAVLQATIDEAFIGHIGDSSSADNRVGTAIGNLPTSWTLHPLGEVCSKIVDGVHRRPDYVDAGVPFLTVENLNRGPGIDFSDTRFVTMDDHIEFCKRTRPERGDVLVSKDGTLGIARVIETEAEFSIFVSIALLKPLRDRLDPWFLRYYFDSTLFKRRLATKISGSALKHIHLVDFRESIIPLPPLGDQESIVRTIAQVDQRYRDCLSEQQSASIFRGLLRESLLDGEFA